MTTRIHDPEQGPYLPAYVDLTATGNTVTVRASNGLMGGTAKVDRAEFLAAVADELDVIVIPRTDLPAVEAAEHGDGSLYYVGGQLADTFSQTPEKLRHTGRRFLALAEHLEQNPPIDEAQVGALWNLMAQHHDDARNQVDEVYGRALARCLVAAGVRAPEAGDNQ